MKKTNSIASNILVAFLLNFAFAVIELFGGLFIGSVAIMSDAVHDFGDSISILLSYLLEKKSKTPKDNIYTYGYTRYSVLGSLLTIAILIIGSLIMIYNAIVRILNPLPIKTNIMLVLAAIGVVANLIAAVVTKGSNSLNQKSVNLHMIEDVLGWIAVFVGALLIKLTGFYIIDPILSIIVSLFILYNAISHMNKIIAVIAEKSHCSIDLIKQDIEAIENVINAHHLHVWSLDGNFHFATVHIITVGNHKEIKDTVRKMLLERYDIKHVTIETESKWEHCNDKDCNVEHSTTCACCEDKHS